MNKQALTFLSLFTLVLMLGVYYVTIKQDDTITVSKDVPADISKAEELEKQIESQQKFQINKLSKKVNNKDTPKEELNTSLQKLQVLKDNMKLQKQLRNKCKEVNYDCVIEIKDNLLLVNVFKQEKNTKLASDIIVFINKEVNGKYIIEVMFK